MNFFRPNIVFHPVHADLIRSLRQKMTLLPIILVFAFLAVLSMGCTPRHYRQKADREVYDLVRHAACDRNTALCDYTITPDCRSRMYDPYDPDDEPMFQDDPCAHRLMHCVDCKKIGKKCQKCLQTQWAENPCWRQYLNIDAAGQIQLDREAALELAMRHSPEYQSALENIYLSALVVSNQRFRFDVQFFGGDSLFYTSSGELIAADGSELSNNSLFGFNKQFATGAELTASLANSITWQFAGPDRFEANSLFNLNFVQPLLRGAGKKIVLEELTQAERNLLANVRQMVFYRQGFYSKVLTGSASPSAPSIGRPQPGVGRSGNFGGYYALLAQQILIQNQEQNLVSLEDNLNRMDEKFEGSQDPRETRLDVEKLRQEFYVSQSRLLGQKSDYQTTVENYLLSTLGLPPDLPVKVEDPLLEQFQLISKRMTDLQARTQVLQLSLRQEDAVSVPDDLFPKTVEIFEEFERELETIHHDYAAMLQKVPERIVNLRAMGEHVARSPASAGRIDPNIFNVELFQASLATIQSRLEELRKRIASVGVLVSFLERTNGVALKGMLADESLPPDVLGAIYDLQLHELTYAPPVASTPAVEGKTVADDPFTHWFDAMTGTYVYKQNISSEDRLYRLWLNRVMDQLALQLMETSLCQARIRLNTITLVPVTISPERAFAVAASNRLDWMNARAGLVDSWRKIRIAANDLKSDLSIQVKGSAGTIENDAIKFDASNSQLSAGLVWDSPLTRHIEQSAYRAALIDYQRARRDYYTYVDEVNSGIRDTIRILERNQIEFEIQRATIAVSTMTVELAQLDLSRPPSAPGVVNRNQNLAQNIIDALKNLLDAQNSFLQLWIGYESRRMGLDLQMGTLRLDEHGRWIDPGPMSGEGLLTAGESGNPARNIIPPAPTLAPVPGNEEVLQQILDADPAPQGEEAVPIRDTRPVMRPNQPKPAPGTLPEAPLPPERKDQQQSPERQLEAIPEPRKLDTPSPDKPASSPKESAPTVPTTPTEQSVIQPTPVVPDPKTAAISPIAIPNAAPTRPKEYVYPLKPGYDRPAEASRAEREEKSISPADGKKANISFASPLKAKDAPPPPPANR